MHSQRQRAVLVRMAESIIPEAVMTDREKAGFITRLEKMISRFSPTDRKWFSAAVLMLDLAPPVFIHSTHTFRNLTSDLAVRYVEKLEHSFFPFSLLFVMVRLLVFIAWYDSEKGYELTGYSPPPTPDFRRIED